MFTGVLITTLIPPISTHKSFEYCQCVVLVGMKLVDLHRAQANVGPHKKK